MPLQFHAGLYQTFVNYLGWISSIGQFFIQLLQRKFPKRNWVWKKKFEIDHLPMEFVRIWFVSLSLLNLISSILFQNGNLSFNSKKIGWGTENHGKCFLVALLLYFMVWVQNKESKLVQIYVTHYCKYNGKQYATHNRMQWI